MVTTGEATCRILRNVELWVEPPRFWPNEVTTLLSKWIFANWVGGWMTWRDCSSYKELGDTSIPKRKISSLSFMASNEEPSYQHIRTSSHTTPDTGHFYKWLKRRVTVFQVVEKWLVYIVTQRVGKGHMESIYEWITIHLEPGNWTETNWLTGNGLSDLVFSHTFNELNRSLTEKASGNIQAVLYNIKTFSVPRMGRNTSLFNSCARMEVFFGP